jgi:hypothetical protein
MRKDSAIIFSVSVLITAAIFGAAHVYSGREASMPQPLQNPEYGLPAEDLGRAEAEPHVSADMLIRLSSVTTTSCGLAVPSMSGHARRLDRARTVG